MIGQSPPRIDGVDKVTGRARYVDDLDVEKLAGKPALVGRTVRSDVPHALLRALELDPKFDWTGVTVVTAADIPGKNVVALIEDDQPALVPIGGRIRHVTEPVALVAAPTAARAEAARKAIRVVTDTLPAVFDPEDALYGDVLVHGKDNVYKKFEIKKGGHIEDALADADLVIEGVYRTGAQEQMYIEPQGMLAWWDERGVCHVVGSMQCPYYVHKAMKVLLGCADEGVVIGQAVTGGGFGGKEEYPSMLAAHVALLARKAGAPVKIVYDRSEDVSATTKRHPAVVRHRLGINHDGTIVAVDIDVLLDGGAYLTLSPVVLSRGVLHAAGPYKIPHVRVIGRVVATNTPPHGAFRGFGAPQTTFAYERQMQKAARALGVTPFELRRKNALRSGDVTATGQTLTTSVGSDAVLDAVLAAAEREAPAAPAAIPGAKRGRGLAFYFHGAGFTGSGEDRLKGKAEVALAPDGAFEVRAGSTDIGQGMLTTFTQIAADALGVPESAVRMAAQSTDRVPDSGPTVASRTCMVVGHVVEQASRALGQRLAAFARETGRDPADVVACAKAYVSERGVIAERHTYASPPGIKWDDATYTGDAYPTYGWAACVVDVAVDPDTHEVTVERCIHAVDVGKAIHPIIVKGQIEGGTLQALGWALWESVQYDKGRVLNHRMTDCIIPTAIEAPELETVLVEVPYPNGPHGAKGVGEIPMDGPAAAVAGAIEDALGVAIDAVPALPERIAEAVEAAP